MPMAEIRARILRILRGKFFVSISGASQDPMTLPRLGSQRIDDTCRVRRDFDKIPALRCSEMSTSREVSVSRLAKTCQAELAAERFTSF